MTVTIPTSEAQYGYVVGRVIRALGDSADPDDKPDAVAATGKVTFTPKATLGRTTDYSAFIVREKIDAPLDAEGNLVRYEGATPAGISLTVGAYKVEFALASGSIPSFDIEVTAAHTQAAPLDLVTAAPYVPPSGVTVNTMLVPADAVVGQVLSWSASGLDWVDMAAAAGGVSSVAGRTGAVVLSSADLTDAASLATDAELAAGLGTKANASHTHAPADITGTAVITTDPRLSDARTPTAHTHTLDQTTDTATRLALTPAERTKLSNTSGTNTGDQTLPTWTTIAGKPAVIAAGATAAAARAAIGAGTSNLAIGTTGTTAAAGNRQATETAIGMVELATTAEATAGTDTQRAVTPAATRAAGDARYVRTVNGTGPDASGNVAVSGGGGTSLPAYYKPGQEVPLARQSNQVQSHGAASWLCHTPFEMRAARTMTSLTCNVTTAIAGGVAHIGIYALGVNGVFTLLHDLSTVSVDTTGSKTITGSWALPVGVYSVGVGRPNSVAMQACDGAFVPMAPAAPIEGPQTGWAGSGGYSAGSLPATDNISAGAVWRSYLFLATFA